MEQTVATSPWKFVPRPIEQKIAGDQTGLLLDHYQLGWVRKPQKDRQVVSNLSRFLYFLLALVGLVSSVAIIVAINDVIQTTHTIVYSIGLLLILPIFFAIVGTIGIFQPSPFCVAAFTECFVCAKKTYVTVLFWHEVASYDRTQINTHFRGALYKHSIHLHNGKTLRWKTNARVMEDLSKIIWEHIV